MPRWYDTIIHRFFRVPYVLHTHLFHNPKKPTMTFVLIHGIGNTLHSWDDVARELPRSARVIGVDLLGFGKSPRPSWARYDAKTQARSVALTLLRLGFKQRVVIIGHSLGALVAVDVARRHPLLVSELVLCSPPFYNPESTDATLIKPRDDILRVLYRTAKKYPEQLAKISALAVRAGVANKSFSLTNENASSYFAALEASIINQTSLQDVAKLTLPINIIYGVLDPVVISSNIVKLGKDHDNITVKKFIVGHELIGGYVTSLNKWLAREYQG